jgi:hypothetical protein
MLSREDRFEYWLIDMDDAIDRFFACLPKHVRTSLDYSPEYLRVLEAWLLENYPTVAAIKNESQMHALDGAARYIGELFRHHLGGKWFIDYSDSTNIFYGRPQIQGMSGQKTQFCPMTVARQSG